MALREPPPYVVSAIEADDRYRRETEEQWDRYLETRPVPARKPSQWDELEAIFATGNLGYCPQCGGWASLNDGVYSCAGCSCAWESDDA